MTSRESRGSLTERLRAARTLDEVRQALKGIGIRDLKAGAIAAACRSLRSCETDPAIRIAFLGSHTFEPVPDYTVLAAALECGLTAKAYTAPYGQYVQEVTGSPSLTHFDPHMILLSLQLRDIAPTVVYDFASLSFEDCEQERKRVVAHLRDWVDAATAITAASILVANFVRPLRPSLGVADQKQAMGEVEFITRLNLELLDMFRESERVHIFDLDLAAARFGTAQAFDRRMYYLAKQPWSEGFCRDIAVDLARYAVATQGLTRKCLVVDLDNTLWGGVVGEDGPESLHIGRGDALGEAYEDFQWAVRAMERRGVILAAASKNDDDDVRAAFERREMPLRLEHFSATSINWRPKSEGVTSLAEDLNIGVESLVFVDDNPAERLEVAATHPAVLVLDFPAEPDRRVDFLLEQTCFERPRVTAEDRGKLRQYREQAERQSLRRKITRVEDYLTELESSVEIRVPHRGELARVHQLFSKTNQFNVTTRRYSIADVERFWQSNQHYLQIVKAEDRFGSLGLVGLYLLERQGESVLLDSFLLSCRALGRGIETVTMNALKRQVRNMPHVTHLVATFIPTRKNSPAQDFLQSQDLACTTVTSDGVCVFEIAVDELREIEVPYVRVKTPLSDES